MAWNNNYRKKGKWNSEKSHSSRSSSENNRASCIPHRTSKRGKLAPLMSEELKQSANIQDLSYDFSCRIVRLFQYLNEDAEYKEYIMSKQVYRSGTSIGANVREAQHGQSDADFLTKMTIAFKEADETAYWINLLHDNGYLNDDQFISLDADNQRILRLLTAITKRTKQKIENQKKK